MPSIRKPRAFHDGDVLDVPGRPIVLRVPGHTPGESALFLPDRGVLISGDTMVTLNLFTGQHGPPQLPRRVLNRDDKLARRSLDRMRELGEVTMLPGHGRPWKGAISNAIQMAQASGPVTRP